ncbi:hypothetical protein GEMRC1_006646 [Eukaryota sp. GEM-RC1]
MVAKHLINVKGNVVLDGFPRTINQATWLLAFCDTHGFNVLATLVVTNSPDAILKRIGGRRICIECGAVFHTEFNPPPVDGQCSCGGNVIQRRDDTPELLKQRFEEYEQKTVPMLDYLEKHEVKKVLVEGNVNPYSKKENC